ncbi:MAG: YicC family protein [Lachnospiraceae bacterium]|jgi:uncharacterized protein (TIGR00255 family)|nr:YicC family protein [Lachnospiraceae bacterium]
MGTEFIKSMTGFGRCEIVDEDRKIVVEMKAVNHRYSDISIRMPKKLNFFENTIRNYLKRYIQRGKVDVFIFYEDYTKRNVCVKYNKELAAEYMNHLRSMAEEFHLDNDIRVSTLSKYPEVLLMEEQGVDEQALWKDMEQVLKGAAKAFVESRLREGELLKEDILKKLNLMSCHVQFIKERSPEILAEYKRKLEEKVRELLNNEKIDEARILTEITIFADKICIDEEIVRLESHIDTMKKELIEGGGVGRKLDFMAQEMNREANTILSKANDLEVSNRAIDLKTEIEKIREQVQNIE